MKRRSSQAVKAYRPAVNATSQGAALVASKQSFDELVVKRCDELGYFERTGSILASVMAMLGAGMLVLAFAFGFNLEIILGAVILTSAVAILVLSFQMKRRSRWAVETYQRLKALKRWLTDFSNLKEAIPTDVKVWNRFLVMAVVLGVSKEVIKQLETVMPTDFFDDPLFVPTWVWVSPHYGLGGEALGDTFSHSFNEVFNTATSSASDGGGGGGGFSGGGGFGGGGGGFGAR
jgi:uncharacterized membrane protein